MGYRAEEALKMSLIVTCPNGHRFPVNLKKHLNRRERYCPKCKAAVNVRPKFWFSPNPDWAAMKQGYANVATKKRAEEEQAKRLIEFFAMISKRRVRQK